MIIKTYITLDHQLLYLTLQMLDVLLKDLCEENQTHGSM